MQTGSYKFGLWKVIVSWEGNTVHQVQFVRTAPAGAVPVPFTKFLAGKSDSFASLVFSAVSGDSVYARIYRAVAEIPYGETRTYREIALAAMAKNPTALIVPCHRVVATNGTLGGFTPDLQIKKDLLKMEAAKKPTLQ